MTDLNIIKEKLNRIHQMSPEWKPSFYVIGKNLPFYFLYYMLFLLEFNASTKNERRIYQISIITNHYERTLAWQRIKDACIISKKILEIYNVPEMESELVAAKGAIELTGALEACSVGFPFRVKELIAHLHINMRCHI